MRKKNVPKICSHCGATLDKENEFFEYKGYHYHNDQLTCIGNLKVKVESLKLILIKINSETSDIL